MRGATVSTIVCTLLLTLFVASSARADTALFRVEQRWHNFPRPPVTTPGGAGMYQGYIQPYYLDTPAGLYLDPPATAIVEPGNPIGGAFTLPQSFITLSGTYTTDAKGRRFTVWYVDYYNGPGKFQPNFGSTASNLRLVFPTTGGNPIPNYGGGNPVTPTTTFGGRYDVSRGGSITVTPGPRRFGGTFRMFHGPNAGWHQFIPNYYTAIYKQYGNYICLDEGKFGCTKDTFASDIGDTTAIYQTTRFLLNVTGTGTGPGYSANTARATTTTTANGRWPTQYGNASYVVGVRRYLNVIHPWTTGFAKVHNEKGSGPGWGTISPGVITPQATGYDISLGGVTLSVKKYDWNIRWNQTLSTLTTTTSTPYTQVLTGVTRIVSMVRPRLIHTYTVPLNTSEDPITNTRNLARLWRLKVFFLPEPTGLLLLSAGLGCLVVLHRLRRRD